MVNRHNYFYLSPDEDADERRGEIVGGNLWVEFFKGRTFSPFFYAPGQIAPGAKNRLVRIGIIAK